ncbi:glycosyltransferase family A protein [Priestia taiwanensis]|uniref:glycosyltransferase family A protein n=1 Tax=Priestia taiwanensis TaxID=1347902 RepID=UPI0027E47FA8|nr:glycosyltransferase family A protein [Priestia taiwanensis]
MATANTSLSFTITIQQYCLPSILDQIYINFEIIVVDDENTDQPATIIKQLQNKIKISFVIFPKKQWCCSC